MTEIRSFQLRVYNWLVMVLPNQVADMQTRAARFLEEAAEAAQAAGLHKDDAQSVLDQVYGRPRGELIQEIGGSITTLCALATSGRIDLELAALHEISRMETPEIIEKVRRRQTEKVTPR